MKISPELIGIGAATVVVAGAIGVAMKRFFTSHPSEPTYTNDSISTNYVSHYDADRYKDTDSTRSNSVYWTPRNSFSTGGKRKSKIKKSKRKL